MKRTRPSDLVEGGSQPLLVAALLFFVGQAALIVLSPLSRATTADSMFSGVILLSSDSYGYLANGTTWSGVGSETWNRWGFLTVIRMGEYLGSGAAFVVLIQAILLTVAGAAAFDLGRRHGGPLAGYVAASVLLLNPMVSQWVRFVLTETIFYSLVILVLWAAARVIAGRGGELTIVTLAVAIACVRPNGVLVGAAGLSALALSRLRTPLRGLAVLLVWVAAAGVLVVGLNDATPRYGWDTAAYTTEGVVIESADRARTTIEMPQPSGDVTSTRELIGYAIEHPFAVSRLALKRIWAETIQVRGHYPSIVNFAVGLFMTGYALAASVGLVTLRGTGLTRTAFFIAVPLALLVGGTFAVPEGRFGWAYLVAFAVHAGVGVARAVGGSRGLTDRISHALSD